MTRKPARRMGLKLGWAVTRRAIWVIGFWAFVLVYGATLFIPSVTGAVLGLLSKMGVSSAVSLTSDVVQLQKKNAELERKSARAQSESKRLAKKSVDLDRQVKSLELDNAKLRRSADTAVQSARKLRLASTKADDITRRMARRTATNASRNLGSMVLEGVPVVGVLTIASVTVLEIQDSCENIKDMAELRSAFGLEPEQSRADEICGYVVPMPHQFANLTISQCEEHAETVAADLGSEAAETIWQTCDCIRLPDGCTDAAPRPEQNKQLLALP